MIRLYAPETGARPDVYQVTKYIGPVFARQFPDAGGSLIFVDQVVTIYRQSLPAEIQQAITTKYGVEPNGSGRTPLVVLYGDGGDTSTLNDRLDALDAGLSERGMTRIILQHDGHQ